MALSRVVVGLSGGVDSAVTAYLLKRQGHEVVGIFMKNWEDDDDSAFCSSNIDFVDAAAVADVIGIEIEHVNFAAEYKDRVFAEFVSEYQAGRTPNPDILCNAEIKFKSFLDHAMRLGAEHIATGHYARVRHLDGQFQLLKGLDHTKDQSYFLHRLNQAQLGKTMFPVGELRKTQVRDIAESIALPNAKKKDSTGICFIGERPFREFLNRYIAKTPGPINNEQGHTIGQHVGLSFYTLGQRQGLGIGGVKIKGEKRGGGAAGSGTYAGGARAGPGARGDPARAGAEPDGRRLPAGERHAAAGELLRDLHAARARLRVQRCLSARVRPALRTLAARTPIPRRR